VIGLETPLDTDRAVRLTPTLPDPMSLPSTPQAAVPPVYLRGASPPEVPSPQAAEALRGVPLNYGDRYPGPPKGESRRPCRYARRAVRPRYRHLKFVYHI